MSGLSQRLHRIEEVLWWSGEMVARSGAKAAVETPWWRVRGELSLGEEFEIGCGGVWSLRGNVCRVVVLTDPLMSEMEGLAAPSVVSELPPSSGT